MKIYATKIIDELEDWISETQILKFLDDKYKRSYQITDTKQKKMVDKKMVTEPVTKT